MNTKALLALTAAALAWGPAPLAAQTTSAPTRPEAALPLGPAKPSVTPGLTPSPDYLLHLSDRIELQFPFSPDYNEVVTVQPDGRISLREVAPVKVVGKSVLDVQALIQQAYSGILHEPRVSLTLKDFQVPSFYASGELGRPGRYELHSEITLLQGIAEAGGLINERARKKEIVVFRPQGNGTYASRVIDLKRMLDAKGVAEDFALAPGDIIYVPQNKASKVQRYLPTTNVGGYLAPAAF